MNNKAQPTVDLKGGPDQRLRHVSEIQLAQRLSGQGQAGENRHVFLRDA